MENTKSSPTTPQIPKEPTPSMQNTSNSLNQLQQEAPISPSNTPDVFSKPEDANNQVPPANVTTIESKKGGKGFGVFVIIGIIAILCIYGYVGYLYLQNQKLKDSTNSKTKQTAIANVTPTPEFDRNSVKVSGGNVIYDDGSGSPKVLVDKSNFTGTGITGFFKVSISPDNSKMCFEAWPPAIRPALYVSSVDGSNVFQVNEKRKNCLWTSDSKKISYVNIPSASLPSDIYLYDIDAKEEKNLTQPDTTVAATKNFELVGLSADGSKIICKYESIAKDESGQCEIDLSTYEINNL